MIVIVDYGMGNLGSMANMFKKIGAPARVSNDPAVIATAEKIVVPGVGAFGAGMENLEQRSLVPILRERALVAGVPVLGVCLGMQLFFESSEEGARDGLGWLQGRCIRFRADPAGRPLKVPHMGWNRVAIRQSHELFAEPDPDERFYFVHAYHVVCEEAEEILGETHYGVTFPSAVVKGNIVGVQFHPEKSHAFGMALLRRFAAWQPSRQ